MTARPNVMVDGVLQPMSDADYAQHQIDVAAWNAGVRPQPHEPLTVDTLVQLGVITQQEASSFSTPPPPYVSAGA